jgi:hypothetical protein
MAETHDILAVMTLTQGRKREQRRFSKRAFHLQRTGDHFSLVDY